jgi:hypothetical protein
MHPTYPSILRYIFVFILFGSYQFTHALQDSLTTINLAGIAEISFPGAYKQIEKNGAITDMSADSNFMYQAVVNYDPQFDPENLTDSELSEFYDGFIRGAIEKSGGKMIKQSPFFIDGFMGIEFAFDLPLHDDVQLTCHTRLILLNSHIITCNVIGNQEPKEALKKAKTRFFSSFIILNKSEVYQTIQDKRKTQPVHYSNGQLGYKLGGLFADLVCAGSGLVFLGIIVLIIFLVVRKNRKKDA